jgi:carbamoyl-phosphate synthase large subunit
MGVGRTFAEAFGKAQHRAGIDYPTKGTVFLSVREVDRGAIITVAQSLDKLGFKLVATRGTRLVIEQAGITCGQARKVQEGRPHIVDMIKNHEINLIVNTTEGTQAIKDSYEIRREALQEKVTYTTTIAGAWALCQAIAYVDEEQVYSLQNLHKGIQ